VKYGQISTHAFSTLAKRETDCLVMGAFLEEEVVGESKKLVAEITENGRGDRREGKKSDRCYSRRSLLLS
jgi:hypothetical protein